MESPNRQIEIGDVVEIRAFRDSRWSLRDVYPRAKVKAIGADRTEFLVGQGHLDYGFWVPARDVVFVRHGRRKWKPAIWVYRREMAEAQARSEAKS